jgi:hypothetical protein
MGAGLAFDVIQPKEQEPPENPAALAHIERVASV